MTEQDQERPGWGRRIGRQFMRNPVVVKELRGRMRGNRAFVVLSVYLLLLSITVISIYMIYRASTEVIGPVSQHQELGKTIYGVIVGLELLAVSFIAPALTAGAISSERERQTYDLLRTTLLPARDLVIGKFGSALIYVLFLLVAAIPIQSLAFLFGGVAAAELVIGTLILFVTAIAFCAMGVFVSSFVKRTLVSTVIAYGFATTVMFALPFLLFIALLLLDSVFTSGPNSSAWENVIVIIFWTLVSLNPLGTVIATEIILLEDQAVFFYDLPLSNGTMTVLSPWIPFTICFLLFSILMLALSIRFVKRPDKA